MKSAPTSDRTVPLALLGAALACVAAMAGMAAQHEVFLGHPLPGLGAALVDGFVSWDSHWYLRIAREGYFYRPGEQSSVAFFPLYPLVIHALSSLGLRSDVAGAAVTFVSGVSAVLLFHRWALTRVSPEAARDGTLLLAFYPFAFYLYGVVYGDALFLMLVIAAFLMLEQGRLGWAILLAALATSARPVAPALVVGLVVRRLEWKKQQGQRWRWTDALPVLAATGFVLWVLYQARTFGEPFAFVKTQGSPGWDQAPGPHTWFKAVWFERMVTHDSMGIVLRQLVHAGVTLFGLALVVPTVKRLGWGYGIYLLAVLGLPAMSSKDFMGMGRYLLAGFPLFLTLGLWMQERPRWRRPALVASAGLLVLLAGAFGADIYVS